MTTRRLSFCLWFVFIIALLLSPTKVLSVESMNRVLRSSVSFLDAQTAQAIDVKLMNTPGFSIDQLMELAGYSVACAAHNYKQNYARDTNNRNVLVFSGPGNNGGDGLVAARHLKHFGYSPKIVYPKAVKSQLFENLVQQCADLNIPILDQTVPIGELDAAGLIIDALFGFSFKGPSREPFSSIIQQFRTTKSPVLSVDIPSGWNVDEGDVHDTGFSPSALISLTLPKRSVHSYEGVHYIGGRFVPPSVEKEFNLRLPDYGFGPDQIVLVENDCKDVDDKIVAMYVTTSSMEEANHIAEGLILKDLAACVNMIPQVKSMYKWEGAVETSQEVLLMIKTRKTLTKLVTAEVKALHSYDLPESIVVDIDNEGSNSDYIRWVQSSTRFP